MMAGSAGRWVRWMAGGVAGALLGTALSGIGLQFVSKLVDLGDPRTFPKLTVGFVSLLLVGINVCICIPAGIAALANSQKGFVAARVLRSAVLGGYLGAL